MVDNFSRGVDDVDLDRLRMNPNVRIIKLDLLESALEQHLRRDYDYIYHFAAIIGVANVLRRPYEVLSKNVRMLEAMLDIAKASANLKRFVFPSTSEVYAGTLQHFKLPIPTPESTALGLTDLHHPRTSYMLSKIYGEALCHQSGSPFVIVRPHNIYGPRMGLAHVIPELLKKAFDMPKGGKLDVFSFDHSRTFCYIDDAVQQIHRAAVLPACDRETLNIGTQAPEITMGELGKLIVDVVGTTTGRSIELVGQPATPGSVLRRCPEMSLTTKRTGYVSQIDLNTGLHLTFDWYRRRIFDSDGISAV